MEGAILAGPSKMDLVCYWHHQPAFCDDMSSFFRAGGDEGQKSVRQGVQAEVVMAVENAVESCVHWRIGNRRQIANWHTMTSCGFYTVASAGVVASGAGDVAEVAGAEVGRS